MTSPYDKHRREIEYCSYCPKLCRFACPIDRVEHSESVIPTGKMIALRMVRDGFLPLDAEFAELIYKCSGCLVSRTYCEHRIEVIHTFETARGQAVQKGVAPEKVMKYAETWRKQGNPFGENHADLVRQIVETRHLAGPADVLLFPGCVMTHYFPQVIRDDLAVLEALGVSVQVFAEPLNCCGQPLRSLGHHELYLEHVKRQAERLNRFSTIVSPCPTCVQTIRRSYAEYGSPVQGQVLHITEFVLPLLRSKNPRVKNPDTRRIIYHDPCHLGRYLGVYDQPREVIAYAASQPPLEFSENRESSQCCGGGGGLPIAHPQIARAIAAEMAGRFISQAAEVLASSCPMCERMLGRAGREKGIVVADVISILRQSIL